MKIIKFAVLLALTFTFSVSTYALADEQFGYSELMATQYARWVSQIKSYDDVTELLPMSAKDRELVNAEIIKAKVNFTNLKVSMLQPTKFAVTSSDGSKVFVSFRQLNKGYLYINEKPLKLEAHKTFYNYQSEVDVILNETAKNAQFKFSFIESAYAQNQKNTLRNLAASMGVSNSHVLFRGGLQKDVTAEPTPDNLEQVLIQAFKNESDRAKAIDKQNKRAPFFTAFTFTCKANSLDTLQEKMLVVGGKEDGRGMSKLQMIDKKSFRYYDNTCDVKINRVGGKHISGNLGNCGIDSTDFYAGAPFFGFTLAASQCCKKAGCAETVRAATAKVTATHIKKPQSAR